VINFDANPVDAELIRRIVARAIREGVIAKKYSVDIEMDLRAVHLNDVPLRLVDMLQAKPFDLDHDILGINRHLDRETGKLRSCFLPRFAAKVEVRDARA